jgi:hypothetical protein
LNGGTTVEEARAVRDVVMKICDASGMKIKAEDVPAGWVGEERLQIYEFDMCI